MVFQLEVSLPGGVGSWGRPGRWAPGLWGSPGRDCRWHRVSRAAGCWWLGFKMVQAVRGLGCSFSSCCEKWGELKVIPGKKVCDVPPLPQEKSF